MNDTNNLIQNGDFEADWADEQSHQCVVFSPDAGPTIRQIGNIFVPPKWTFWFYHDPKPHGQEGNGYDQPEGRDAHASGDARRVHSGLKAYTYFTFHRRHDAGLFQQVQVEEGARYLLSGYAHAWSSTDDNPHTSDGASGPFFAPEGAEELNSDLINFTFWVGVDPTGGLDPFADTVMWGHGAHIYNEHAAVGSVPFRADTDTITVFLRSRTLWPFKHNDAYWDDVQLVRIDEPIPEPEPTPIPDPNRGLPREQYARTYVLLHPDAGQEWATAVIDSTWESHRYTVGGSADDSGIGALDAKRVIAVNPQEWPGGAEALRMFFVTYYPGTEYVVVEAETPDELRNRLDSLD